MESAEPAQTEKLPLRSRVAVGLARSALVLFNVMCLPLLAVGMAMRDRERRAQAARAPRFYNPNDARVLRALGNDRMRG